MLSKLAKITLFLAPSGIFFLPIPALGSFRTFYIPLLFLNLIAIANLWRRQLAEVAVLVFLFGLFWFSAAYGYIAFDLVPQSPTENPFVRWVVIANLGFGFYFLGCWLDGAENSVVWFKRVDITYYGFIVVFSLGFLLYLSVVFGPVPASFYKHFVTVEQSAFGYLRLSPGTYPNEFGTLCSFFAIYALIKNSREGGLVPVTIALLSLIGIALASTRSAYVTLICGTLIVIVGMPSLKRQTQAIVAIMIAVPLGLLLLNALSFNTIGVIQGGYSAAMDPSRGSLGTRLTAWATAYGEFVNFPFWGFGFESSNIIFLHNLFLQEIFGLGLLGSALAILLSIVFWMTRKWDASIGVICVQSEDRRYMMLIRLVALEHTVLFGLNNHNQSHFLTWLTFALFVSNIFNFDPNRQARESG
ncbi:O-antigen ligase family protein [Salinisphaera sp. Q1T1-3]|uniref:O-antigen ligase family protein n=1 Tax=Salinisphaera sp. Q1T1-3 TaxID=2321229 RepID=UPI0011C459E4|nr:O-antigen ligase family protein [Salinisphaera sp. Q1T1-3]